MSNAVLTLTQDYYQAPHQKQEEKQQQQQVLPLNFFTGKKVGSGKTSDVFQCHLNEDLFAIKQYKQNHLKFMKNEVFALQQLAHPNIIEYIGQVSSTGLLMEYLQNGEVFDYIQTAGDKFPSELARYYSMQLSHAVAYLHNSDFAHLDIKLENCLFDDNFNLKLADFGFAVQKEQGAKHDKFIGTHRYMSPEIEKAQPYDAQKADIFALGCVIFILELGFQPIYAKATETDKYYQYFAANQLGIFWKWLEKQYRREFNPEFKDLIAHMMCKDPSKRYNIEQVLNHNYFKGKVYDREARINYMSYLKASIVAQSQH